ncbi:MAG: superoxide dismutase [Bacteroidaceae bacterium]|nr:superoxide dismutase [Bacteroidaceae bacterium]
MKKLFTNLMMTISCGVCYAQEPNLFELIKLPYETYALEPYISRETIEFHHGKHLATYVKNLNKLIAGTYLEKRRLPEIILESRGALFNNAAQVLNHNLYFLQFSPNGGTAPTGMLGNAINRRWGCFNNFKREFEEQCLRLFGSGWVWLAEDEDGELHLLQLANADTPLSHNMIPILGFDVWEHAYYLDFQNNRADHIAALWHIINWEVVNSRYISPM